MLLQDVARRILQGGSLADKLMVFDSAALADGGPLLDRVPDAPMRAAGLAIRAGAEKLPALKDLGRDAARAECLHRFANHELQAVELFAWAALRFPDTPWSFRVGLMRTLTEEQAHLRAYLQRMETYGMGLEDAPLSANFWEHVGLMDRPQVFACAMGLTLESANLDFTLLYRDAFARAGAPLDAAVMQQVHTDEVGHVAWSLSWLRRFKDPSHSDLQAYLHSTPFPLGLHRAKGRNFVASARRSAGLDAGFIQAMRDARSPQQDASLRPWNRQE
jgi:uncharacterized ferritin-like protein (DUF455 family)